MDHGHSVRTFFFWFRLLFQQLEPQVTAQTEKLYYVKRQHHIVISVIIPVSESWCWWKCIQFRAPPLPPNVSRDCGVNIVMTTITFDKEALTGSNNEQSAAQSRAAEWKSVPAGRSEVTPPLLTAILEHADTTCETVKKQPQSYFKN